MRFGFIGAVVLAAGPALAAGGQPPQVPTATAAGPEYSLYVSVLDSRGAAVVAVDSLDLSLRVGGMSADIVRVVPAKEPMTIALLVDHCTTSLTSLTDLRRGLKAFVGAVAGPNRVALMTVGGAPTLLVRYTDDAAMLTGAAGGLTRLACLGLHVIDAIREVYQSAEIRRADRAVVVALVGHGGDADMSDVAPLLTVVRDSHVPLFVVRFQAESAGAPAPGEQSNLAALLTEGPTFSGGLRLDLLSASALQRQLARLAAILSNQYRVDFRLDGAPANAQAYRLEVFSTRSGWRVLAPVSIRFVR